LDVPAEGDPTEYEQTTCIVHQPHMLQKEKLRTHINTGK
jgi:hypothetical protein